jgi:hypothetical protein
VTVLLVAAAVIAGAGAIAAMAPFDVRLGIVGLTASLVGAALLADPLPAPAVLGIRLTAALLAVVTLRAVAGGVPSAARHAPGERGSPTHDTVSLPGWPAQLLLGLAGAAAGLAIASGITTYASVGGDVGQPTAGLASGVLGQTSLDLAVAGLLVTVAFGPALTGQIGLRRTMAAILLTEAAILVRSGLAPAPGVLEEIAFGAVVVAVAAAGSLLAGAAGQVRGHGADAPGGRMAELRPRRP